MNFSDLYNQSINDKQAFWGEQAKRIYWHQQPTQILDDSKLPFAKWFVGGETNLCYNMVDRHLENRAEQDAFVWVSTEINAEMIDNYPNIQKAFHRSLVLSARLPDKDHRLFDLLRARHNPCPPLLRQKRDQPNQQANPSFVSLEFSSLKF